MNLDIIAQQFQSKVQEFNSKYDHYEPEPEPVVVESPEIPYDNSFLHVDSVWEDVKAKLDTNQFYALSTVGSQGSGKSNLGKEFFRKALQDKFKCIYGLPEDFIGDIDGWIDRILVDVKEEYENGNIIEQFCVMLDDLSYSNDAQGRRNQALFKNVISRIRHKFTLFAEENKISAKVFIIYVTHRLHAAPPILRNSGSWIFTEMQAADRDDALEIIGKNKELRERLDEIYTFLNTVIFEGAKHGLIKYTLNDKNYVFKWGKQTNPGDGRLMAIYHAGEIGLYNTKYVSDLNFKQYRYEVPEVIEEDD
ncbi:hypothetical protein HOV56_gp16 [Nitrosopumilus spindle-shaped virus]|uniref:Uncharacterized protein n=1 Tax=Nitrosopumilus spindle-shaped virus TaxID=2508184 RepID=A0A514K2U8_9VIRU|nr:hypothetical protein HOV56_gp16 [Nitrosopumilus spindle-shaped virus]YP_010772845.1 hypothetical protein QIT54_gp15 [Nitrosopumilus spindle-shaped virus]QDI73905.1 hypothetical protein [Nitrosopumilus spindle-shaped virus]QDI73953.1 hypothetical protein [Nitrosopumilus spindle-shaped virus]